MKNCLKLQFRTLLSVVALFFLSACKDPSSQKNITPAFYFWQSSFALSAQEEKQLEQLAVQKIYCKFFDVTWDAASAQPVPVAALSFTQNMPAGVEAVPVIFITNETLQKINAEDISTLAFKINKKIESILIDNGLAAPKEIQLDCDWSETTANKYFSLIRAMKEYPSWQKIVWSATIRLHQVKYFEKTGVPPVNRGLLMFYNMGDIEDAGTKNSIYDSNTAGLYTERIKEYPLPLDAAIACFSWGLLFDNSTLLKIFYPLYPANIPDSLFQQQGENLYRAKRDFYFEGSFLVRGNLLRLETMTPAVSLESANLLASQLKNDSLTVILYHLDSTIANTYTYENFKNIYSAFQ